VTVRAVLDRIHRVRIVDARLGTSGQPTEGELAAIAAAGYRTVVNLALHDDPRYSLPDERATVEGLGMRYVHIPVAFDAPTEADLLAFFDAMRAHGGQPLWVHCAANLRVLAFLGLWRTIVEAAPREAAFAPLHAIWQPDPVWSAFIEAMLERHAPRDARPG
jgi:protein tyrosine phosphatase (PTP) superfamily phosphohydrolase (DUF442 family)